jgi:hypothetical protein
LLKKQIILMSILSISLVFLITAACSKEKITIPLAATTIQLAFSNLPPMEDGFYYRAWAVDYDSNTGQYTAYPLDAFNTNANNQIVDLDGAVIENGEFTINIGIAYITDVALSIEDTDANAVIYYMGGDVSDSTADLTVGHEIGIGTDFANAAGKYILATPTDTDSTDENSGIWFIDLASGLSQSGLTLPTLPAEWKYEGWVNLNGTWLTTGKFTDVDTADDSSLYSGPEIGPEFPGEDFLVDFPGGPSFPTDLAESSVMITIEPVPDNNSEEPFYFKILEANIPLGAVDHTTYTLTKNADPLPSGTAVLKVATEE